MGNSTSILAVIPCFPGSNRKIPRQGTPPVQSTLNRSATPSFESSGHPYDHPAYSETTNSSVYTSPYITPAGSITEPAQHQIAWPIDRGNPPNTPSSSYATLQRNPNNRFVPTIHVTCAARSTDPSEYPSVFLYDNNPLNPTIRQPMQIQLEESETSGGHGFQGYTAEIRSINDLCIEFRLFGVGKDACLSAHLIVPRNRVSVSNDQLQLHRSIQFWTPAVVDSPVRYQAIVDYAKGCHAEIPGKSSSVPDLSCGIPFSPLKAPLPALHRTVPPQYKTQWFEY